MIPILKNILENVRDIDTMSREQAIWYLTVVKRIIAALVKEYDQPQKDYEI